MIERDKPIENLLICEFTLPAAGGGDNRTEVAMGLAGFVTTEAKSKPKLVAAAIRSGK